jgi:hypothetical protein
MLRHHKALHALRDINVLDSKNKYFFCFLIILIENNFIAFWKLMELFVRNIDMMIFVIVAILLKSFFVVDNEFQC